MSVTNLLYIYFFCDVGKAVEVIGMSPPPRVVLEKQSHSWDQDIQEDQFHKRI